MATREAQAREHIYAQSGACGWVVQDFMSVDFSVSRGRATARCASSIPLLVEQTRIVTEVGLGRRLSAVEKWESVVLANLLRATRLSSPFSPNPSREN